MFKTISLAIFVALLVRVSPVLADSFDLYTNNILFKVPEAPGVKKIRELTPEMMVENCTVLPGIRATFVVVKTNEGQWSKLLVSPARQKITKEESVPILLMERFVTFWEGEEKAVFNKGGNIRLFADFRFNLDMGQVVPAGIPADLHFVCQEDKQFLEPVGKAEMFLITQHLAEANPKSLPRPETGATFSPDFFNGRFKLHDDGRRTGILDLKVGKDNEITGSYFSSKDDQRYEVVGKIGNPNNSIQFRIIFPRSVQNFQGWLFTADGQAITGYASFSGRETGFYAIRQEK